MKTTLALLLLGAVAVCAETVQETNRTFHVEPGVRLLVDVAFGSIDVKTNAGNDLTIEVVRRITRGGKTDEEGFLNAQPILISQEGNTITVRARSEKNKLPSFRGKQRVEGHYTIGVPAKADLSLKTSGGPITVSDVNGEVKSDTQGGSLKFAHLRGTLVGRTSGGAIQLADCEGDLKVSTQGGDIDLAGGSGSFDGETSGGSIKVKNFRGPVDVETKGGGITVENVTGKIDGETSGGAITARLPSVSEEVKLETKGGSVTMLVPENAAFDLDASASGQVKSELTVNTRGKQARNRLKGSVNNGGKVVVLRTHGGNVQVKKL